MTRILALTPWIGILVYQLLGLASGFRPEIMQPLTLGLSLGLAPIIWYRRLVRQASDLELAIAVYLVLAFLVFWLFPENPGQAMSAAALYGVFFLMAAVPPLWGQEPFTCHFARWQTPPTGWGTALYKEINQHLTIFWAGLFALSFLVSLVGALWTAPTSFRLQFVWAYLVPLALQAGLGVPVTRWYLAYRRRRPGPLLVGGRISTVQTADPHGDRPPTTQKLEISLKEGGPGYVG